MVKVKAKHKPCRNATLCVTFPSRMEGRLLRKGFLAMKKRNAVLVGVLAGVMLASPVLAAANDANEACLKHNRIFSTKVINQTTVLATDWQHNRFTIHVNPGCPGITYGASHLVFRTWQNLACVGVGDLIGVQVPGMGFVTCAISAINGVTAGAPAP